MSAVKALKNGQLAIIPTDTLYGVVGRALDPVAVDRIYKLKGRAPEKPFIILISSIDDLAHFGVEPDSRVEAYWPGAVSIILPCEREDLAYLHRGTQSLAFRLPAKSELIEIIREAGPLVAPSANPEGHMPARTIDEAFGYFGEQVAHYMDGGVLEGAPSRLIRLNEDGEEILR